ncbi:hypothetical protein HAX54_048114 [Datura stramonium]|uniref:NB-ARC domain-containing protein n=1 Tax=Datura stramonium TaxID=4076 RepID=A0ABS8STE8_DATST|nr:hypothetical protein [Datura stramonium]
MAGLDQNLEIQKAKRRLIVTTLHACKLKKMAQNDIGDVLDHLRRINQNQKSKLIVKKLHSVFGGIPDECKNNLILERLKSLFLEFIEGNTSSVCNFELNDDSDLSEYMDCLGNNLNDVLMCLELERNEKLKNFPTDVTARNIDVAMRKFLLFLLGDVPNHVINGNSLNEVLEKIGVLVDLMMKPSIGILEEELSSLTFVFRRCHKVQHKHDEILNDLQRRTVDLAYEAEASIDSILVQYNFLCHFSCSLPAIIKEIKHIRVQVMEGNELDVIPIVGMGDRESNYCKKAAERELLQEIFSQVTGSKDKVDVVSDLADMLRKRLMHKRYLIVLDDMWDVAVWEDLILSFPNGENRSRIIVTTRLENVGKQVKYHTDPYSLPFLSLDESCKLLQKKVFQQESCPPELQDVSLEIAEKCKGLPLVIILVAGIIKRNKMEASRWDKVKNSLLSYLERESGRLMEETAEDYLNDLISSKCDNGFTEKI